MHKTAVTKPTQTFVSFSILSLVYVLLSIGLPPVAATLKAYHLSATGYRVLVLLIALPVVAMWFAAFYGYAQLEQYAQTIKKTPDGKAFASIGRGLRWLAWGLPITSLAGNVLGGVAHEYPHFGSMAIIVTHYTSLIISVIAFTIINTGTRGLTDATGKQPSLAATRGLMVSFIFLAITYCYVTIRTVQTQAANPYQLPMWLILLTIVIPYLYAWLMGLLASYEISLYRRHIRGVFYKRALNLVAGGMGLTILSSIVLQYLTSSSPYLRRINLNWVLLIVFAVLMLYAAGFLLIAVGATKLKKIEEV
jgi:hypothetical protein